MENGGLAKIRNIVKDVTTEQALLQRGLDVKIMPFNQTDMRSQGKISDGEGEVNREGPGYLKSERG